MVTHHDFTIPPPHALGPHPRILVVKLATLGDVTLMTPMLRALRQRYPAAQLDLLTTAAGSHLLAHSPLIDQRYALDTAPFDSPATMLQRPTQTLRLGAHTLATLFQLRRNHYDALLLAHHLTLPLGRLKHRLLTLLIAAHLTVGLENGHGSFLDIHVPDEGFGAHHEAQYGLALARALDAAAPKGQRGLQLADMGWGNLTCRATTSSTAAPLIALHPGSGAYSPARRWPLERYIELAQALHDQSAARIVLIAGPEERELAAQFTAQLAHPDWLIAPSALGADGSPRGLAQLLSQCALFIGNDSFPMHLATLVGAPVVAIFGPTNVAAWRPYTTDSLTRATVVRRSGTDLACMPCIYRGHALGTPQGCPPRPCLTTLPMMPVLRAALRLLDQRIAQHPSLAAGGVPDG